MLSEAERIAQFETEKQAVTQHIYEQSKSVPMNHEELPNEYDVSGHSNAVEMMRMRTQQQMYQRETSGMVQDPRLAEKTTNRVVQQSAEARNDEQMRIRDEQLRINNENIQKYQQQANQAATRDKSKNNMDLYPQNNQYQGYVEQDNNYVPPTPPSKPPVNTMENFGQNPSNINPQIIELSQPNYNAPFDVIPLPSKGKLYKNKKPNVKVAYMTTADENILTSPNLLQSGEFLEVLMNRKILEPGLRYKVLVNNTSTYKMERQLIEVNGNRDRNYIRDFASTMRIADAKALNDYINSIESGIDLKIEVTTPGGGSIATFLPLTTKFFWPNF